ncbi:CIC11C00000002615 [Sungouiella intermedia]|uniref:CIC11C00000002615 n=1 Tax=Sungouiella intermedia TaxID=45354 RepID=A0A1L0BPQ9_9ASCO|nr:CIC11C00000002615 [[Candida] intermedia]
MLKSLYKELQKELLVAHRKSYAVHWKKNLEKNKAKLMYTKLQLIKSRKPTGEVEAQIKALESGKIEYPPLKTEGVRELVDSDNDIANLKNVITYLRNQRVYNELLERYSPGLTMSQEDNVRKTANMVGLAVPEK